MFYNLLYFIKLSSPYYYHNIVKTKIIVVKLSEINIEKVKCNKNI